jgi:hypothetical protein
VVVVQYFGGDDLNLKRLHSLELCKVDSINPAAFTSHHLNHYAPMLVMRNCNEEDMLPVALYCEAAGNFFSNWKQGRSTINIDGQDVEIARRLAQAMGGAYPTNHDRSHALNHVLDRYFDDHTFAQLVVKEFATDASLVTNNIEFPLLIRVDGRDGPHTPFDPIGQAAICYIHAVGERSREAACSNLPCILLSATDQTLRVAFAITGVKVMIDYGPVMSMAGVVESGSEGSDPEALFVVARLLKCLKFCVRELTTYYLHLHIHPSDRVTLHRRVCFPYFETWDDGMNKIHYKHRLGELSFFGEMSTASVDGTLSPRRRDVLVKFCQRYSVAAHQAAAQFAPELLYHNSGDLLPGGWLVLVIDYMTDCEPWSACCIDDYKSQLTRAVKRLHSKKFVLGNIRASNVIVQRDTGKAYITNFEWADEVSVARYPADIYSEKNSRLVWPDGAVADGAITREHDSALLNLLFER